MKAFWDDMFYDRENLGWDDSLFATRVGATIRMDLDEVMAAIMSYDTKIAIELIRDMQERY